MRFLLLAIILAGCAGPALEPAVPLEPAPETIRWETRASSCETVTVFFLVEPAQVWPHLPLGYRPGDFSEFIYNNPYTSGMVPAFVATSHCDAFEVSRDGETQTWPLEVSYVGFFVEPPNFDESYANQPFGYDFYVTDFYGPVEGQAAGPGALTSRYGWPNRAATTTLELGDARGIDNPIQNESLPGYVQAVQANGHIRTNVTLIDYKGRAAYPHVFDPDRRLRFWTEDAAGTGFMEFGLPYRTVNTGPLEYCTLAGRILEVIGTERCTQLNSFNLIFTEHDLQGRLYHMPGVHAR